MVLGVEQRGYLRIRRSLLRNTSSPKTSFDLSANRSITAHVKSVLPNPPAELAMGAPPTFSELPEVDGPLDSVLFDEFPLALGPGMAVFPGHLPAACAWFVGPPHRSSSANPVERGMH